MKNYKKHIDDFFREKLGRYKETPPDDVWEGLQGKLDTLKPYVPKAPFRWAWHFGMVSLITVLSVSLTRKFNNKPAEPTTQTEVATVTQTQQPTIVATQDQTGDQQNAVAATGEQAANNNPALALSQPNSSVATSINTSGSNPVKGDKRYSNPGYNRTGGSNQANGHIANNTTNSSKKASQHQLVYASAPGSQAKSINAGKRVAANKKQHSSNKKRNAFFSSSNSMAQLSSAMDNADNNTAEAAATKTAQQPAETNSLAAAPVKNIKKEIKPEALKNVAEKVTEKKAEKPTKKRFDFGVKAGYEQGFNSSTATKWVVAPYLQYHVASKISLMLQPGIKYATIAQRNVGKAQTYYSVNQDGKVVQNGGTVIDSIRVVATNVDTYYHNTYRYSQSHDSIVRSRTIGGSYVEFELPILLQYAVSKQVSVYGGVNLIYSRRMVVSENTFVKTGIQRSIDSTIYGTGTPASSTPPQMSNVFTYTGNPYSDYQNPGVYPMKQENILRVGYMLGLTYQYSDRWLFDALIQHSPLKPDVKDGYNLNSSLSSPYFRLSVGYKLTK